jgi:hypothetical protein
MSESSQIGAVMTLPPGKYSELRLIIHCYPKHTTAALITRDRRGSENWDRRIHAWDLPLPQRDYDDFMPEDQLWTILGALAEKTRKSKHTHWAEPPEPPDGGYRGEQGTLFDDLR